MHYSPYYITCITAHVFVGGHDGLSIFNSVERYDPELQQWMLVADMNCQRCRLGVVAAAGKIIRYETMHIHTLIVCIHLVLVDMMDINSLVVWRLMIL